MTLFFGKVQKIFNKKTLCVFRGFVLMVGLLGIEPRLF